MGIILSGFITLGRPSFPCNSKCALLYKHIKRIRFSKSVLLLQFINESVKFFESSRCVDRNSESLSKSVAFSFTKIGVIFFKKASVLISKSRISPNICNIIDEIAFSSDICIAFLAVRKSSSNVAKMYLSCILVRGGSPFCKIVFSTPLGLVAHSSFKARSLAQTRFVILFFPFL